jgi:TusA-related sulfurtransferase
MVVAMSPAEAIELDVRGRLCPAPILALADLIGNLAVGTVIRVRSDDAAIALDLPAWCTSTGHELLRLERHGREHWAMVRKMHDRTL